MSINAQIWKSNVPSGLDEMLKNLEISPKASAPVKIDSFIDPDPNQPLIVLLHGWGSNEADLPGVMSLLTNELEKIGADQPNWVSLRAPLPIQPNDRPAELFGGFYWFEHPIPDNIPLLESLANERGSDIISWVDQQIANGRISADKKLIFFGFSQGAVMATHLLTRLEIRDKIAATICLSGYLPFVENFIPYFAENSPLPRVFHGFGNADDIVIPKYSFEVSDWLSKNTDAVNKVYQGMMHNINYEEVSDIAEFLKPYYVKA